MGRRARPPPPPPHPRSPPPPPTRPPASCALGPATAAAPHAPADMLPVLLQAACCSSACASRNRPPCCMASRRARWSSWPCRMAALGCFRRLMAVGARCAPPCSALQAPIALPAAVRDAASLCHALGAPTSACCTPLTLDAEADCGGQPAARIGLQRPQRAMAAAGGRECCASCGWRLPVGDVPHSPTTVCPTCRRSARAGWCRR